MKKGTLMGAMALALASGCGGGGVPTATGQLQVMARCQTVSTTSPTELIYFKVLNAGEQTIPFADITVRYYLSYKLTNGATPAAEFDYVQSFQLTQLTRTFSSRYFELGFTPSTGDLAASDSVGSGEIAARLHANDFSDWNSSRDDDYSFTPCDDPTVTTYQPRATMTAYVGDSLAWGVEP